MASLSSESIATIKDIIRRLNPDKVFLLADSNTSACCLPLIWGIAGMENATVLTIPAGEEYKTLTTATTLWQQLTANRATRHSLLLCLGGGTVSDIGGFVASTFKRGMRFVNIPTTLLAMVDAAVGGKNGVNFHGLKNQIGTIAQPQAIVTDARFLSTLPREEILSGYGEMLKHALLSDEARWARFMLSPALLDGRGTPSDWQKLIAESRMVKENIVSKDPFESGMRKALNLGHTIGHAIEERLAAYHAAGASTPYSGQAPARPAIRHGVAVAHGIVGSLYLSVVRCGFPTDKMRQTVKLIRRLFGTVHITCDDYDELYRLALHDKKNFGDTLRFVLLKDVGCPVVDQAVDKEDFFETLDFIREG